MPAGAERLLWVSPALPYVHPKGLFAEAAVDLKRLIFTEWRLAPDAISAMVSYEMGATVALLLICAEPGPGAFGGTIVNFASGTYKYLAKWVTQAAPRQSNT